MSAEQPSHPTSARSVPAVRIERTHDWQVIQLRLLSTEQEGYEQIRNVVVFGESIAERAQELGIAPPTLARLRPCLPGARAGWVG